MGRLMTPDARRACSMESIRRCSAPVRRANSVAMAVFPTPGRPPKMIRVDSTWRLYPVGRHWKPFIRCVLAKIREIEYPNVMPNQLRAYQATVFQALAHPTRIAIVEILRDGELSAGALQARLGIEQANLSQHLTILRSRQIVVNRKGGNQVFYSLPNPVLGQVLDIMRHYCQTNLHQAIQMMGEMNREAQD